MTKEPKTTQAKTIVQLIEDYKDWKHLFRQGANGNREAYNRARDTRHLYEERLWVPQDLVDMQFESRTKTLAVMMAEDLIRKHDKNFQDGLDRLAEKLHDRIIQEHPDDAGWAKKLQPIVWAWFEELLKQVQHSDVETFLEQKKRLEKLRPLLQFYEEVQYKSPFYKNMAKVLRELLP